MPDEPNQDRNQSNSARRVARLAQALRANLRRRKAQAKGRSGVPAGADPAALSHDSAGILADKRNR